MITVKLTINADEVIANTVFDPGMITAAYDGLYSGGEHVMEVVSEYPPVSEANTPGPYPNKWYVRGTGPHWALKGGGFHFRKTSEQLNKRWTIDTTDDGATVVIGNNASYAPDVHSLELQPAFHADRGWKTAEAVIESERPIVIEKIKETIGAYLESRKK